MKSLKELIEEGIASIALLPERNDYLLSEAGKQLRQEILAQPPEKIGKEVEKRFHTLPPEKKQEYLDLSKLESLTAYTIPLVAHDYAAKTPIMWNMLYEKLGLRIRNIMVVANPENTRLILKALKSDPRYIGGGAGVGFKESSLPFLDKVDDDIKAVNIIVKDNGSLVGYNTDSLGFVKSLEEKLQGIKKSIKGGNFIVVGAGGVAKDMARLLAEKEANYIAIVNRTFSKAVALAKDLNEKQGRDLAIGVGENMTRGILLNSEVKPDAIINLSDKGSDKLPEVSMFYRESPENENISRSMVRNVKELRPDIIYADIVLPSSGRSISLRIVKSEGIDDKFILDGKPMVIYQAAPAYVLVQEANSKVHVKKVTEAQALTTFKKAANL